MPWNDADFGTISYTIGDKKAVSVSLTNGKSLTGCETQIMSFVDGESTTEEWFGAATSSSNGITLSLLLDNTDRAEYWS